MNNKKQQSTDWRRVRLCGAIIITMGFCVRERPHLDVFAEVADRRHLGLDPVEQGVEPAGGGWRGGDEALREIRLVHEGGAHHLRRAISGDFLVLAAGAAAVAVASIWAPPTDATSALVISASMKYSAICTSLTPRSSSSCVRYVRQSVSWHFQALRAGCAVVRVLCVYLEELPDEGEDQVLLFVHEVLGTDVDDVAAL